MHIRNDPSFFLTNRTGAPHGDELVDSARATGAAQSFLKWTRAPHSKQMMGIVAGRSYSPWPGGQASAVRAVGIQGPVMLKLHMEHRG
ncbi:hypothetical protein Tco_0304062 [Tanacetum coccineum]